MPTPSVNTLTDLLKSNREEVARIVADKPDWSAAAKRFDAFFARLSDPKDALWSLSTMKAFGSTYFAQRDKDKGMSNIVTRTVPAMPKSLQNEARLIFLQMAEVCTFFNAQHKVNFGSDELPEQNPIEMAQGKAKGSFVLARPMPPLYPKTSLTFDYWVPKLLDWMEEVRSQGHKTWRGEAILHHEACTDFMRIALLFLNDPRSQPPVAKAEEREKLLILFGKPFTWIKKSTKREDIPANSVALREGLGSAAKAAHMDVPLEAWSRILRLPPFKALIA